MKKRNILLAFASVSIGVVTAQDTPPAIGSIVPDDLTFFVSETPAAELASNFPFRGVFQDLVPRKYTDFDGEIVVTVHHAPW